MFRTNELYPSKETINFLKDLKEVLGKHNVVMYSYGELQIHFSMTVGTEYRHDIVRCSCVSGMSKIG